MPTLESSLASRYLRLPRPRSLRMHLFSLVFGLFAVCVFVAWHLASRGGGAVFLRFPMLRPVLQWGRPIAIAAFILVFTFVVLARRLNIFTTISTYGLFIGTGAMVIVLGIMSGFEKDLRSKILGANAHIVVTAPERSFTDHARAQSSLQGIPGVVAITPFLSSEAMISSPTNLAGVVLKGIDPGSVGRVTDLSRNMEQGKLEFLSRPEGIAAEAESEMRRKAAADDDVPDDPELRQALARLNARDGGVPAAGPSDGGAPAGADEVVRFVPAARKAREGKQRPAVIIGRELAKNLRVYLGDDVNLISPMGDIGPTGTMPRSRPFVVGGIFYSGMYEYDSKFVYVTIPVAQRFLGLEDEITGLEMKVADSDETAAPVAEIRRRLGQGYDVMPWQDLNRHLFSALDLEQKAMFVVLCFVILVASFSIVANGVMLVREKGREIAILKSMGITDGKILRVFLDMGLFMGGIGTVAGTATGVLGALGLRLMRIEISSDVFYISQLPVEVKPVQVLVILSSALLIAMAAILYPAYLAARMRPVEGLRYDRG